MRRAVFIDLSNFYSRLIQSGLGDPREVRDYFLHWLDLGLLTKSLTGSAAPTWVFYSGQRLGAKSERVDGQHLTNYIKRLSRQPSVTPCDVNIPGDQREVMHIPCESCGKQTQAQWISEKGIDTSLIVHLFDTADSWDEAFLLSGDADFVPAVRALRRKGKLISGAGFSNTSEALIREFYAFEDLSQDLLREDFVLYLLFREGGLIEKWLEDDVPSTHVIQNKSQTILRVKWILDGQENTAPNSIYSGGNKLHGMNPALHLIFEDNGMENVTERCAGLNLFIANFPNFKLKTRHLLLPPRTFDRADVVLDRLLPKYSGTRNGSAGMLEATHIKNEHEKFIRCLKE